MTTLGQAYVQIMPSAKGISGSIQKVINPEATKAGKSAGMNIASSMAKSMSKAGKSLTKAITVPALGAAASVGGLVGALGWGRLTGLDAARSQLQGLGYDAESVERISSLVNDSIQGTVTTMAEGVSVAAGGLAAGVKEGAELERYIKLVGDAAVGAGRSTDEMAQIFNRVQGGGRLMTQELNMIEQGMPGFAMAMAESLGVPQDEFRNMVTAGEVSSDQFLNVMDSFAGEMSDAYASSWAGMVANTKSNIGIIGETLLGGVFEQSKESIAEFLEYLRSDDVREWAAQTGEVVGEAFSNLIERVKGAIEWWTNLDESTKSLIFTIGGIVIAIGPILMIAGKLITTIITVHGWFSKLRLIIAPLVTAISGISAPVLIVTGVIVGLIAIITRLYQSNEGFRDLVNEVWATIKETISTVIEAVSDFVMEVWGMLTEWWDENNELIRETVQRIWDRIEEIITVVIQEVSDFVMSIFGGLVEWWDENNELIRETIEVVWNKIKEIIEDTMDYIVPRLETAWEIIQTVIETVWDVIKTVVETAIDTVMGIIRTIMQIITGDWRGAWQTIRNTVSNLLGAIRDIISRLLRGAFNIIKSILNNIKNRFSSIFNGLRDTVRNAFNRVRDAVRNGMQSAFDAVKNFFGRFKDAGRNIVTNIADGIKGAVSKVTDAIGNVTQKVRDFLPFSPPKIGPLTDIMDVEWGETIAGGINKGEDEVAKAMDEMLSIPLRPSVYNGDLSKGENDDVVHLLTELIQAVKEGKNIIMDDREVGRIIEPVVTETQERNRRVRGSFV